MQTAMLKSLYGIEDLVYLNETFAADDGLMMDSYHDQCEGMSPVVLSRRHTKRILIVIMITGFLLFGLIFAFLYRNIGKALKAAALQGAPELAVTLMELRMLSRAVEAQIVATTERNHKLDTLLEAHTVAIEELNRKLELLDTISERLNRKQDTILERLIAPQGTLLSAKMNTRKEE